jgi:LPXTG-motif cell wall-anchored protein
VSYERIALGDQPPPPTSYRGMSPDALTCPSGTTRHTITLTAGQTIGSALPDCIPTSMASDPTTGRVTVCCHSKAAHAPVEDGSAPIEDGSAPIDSGDQSQQNGGQVASSRSPLLIVGGIGLLVAGGMAFLFIRRKRRKQQRAAKAS